MCPDNNTNLDNKIGEYKGIELRDYSNNDRTEYSINRSSDRSTTLDAGQQESKNTRSSETSYYGGISKRF
ncbi:hypothetical protein ACTFRO_28665 [Bacillus cereus group sp. MYBK163-2]|uniref:hypothetical protein n=1 Tax=Bacillus cereus group TaxID=86661 RepID=UPI000A303A97|nr:hypothetical protein [Bacillus cereus]SME68402.1 hypothetical protein BACERE00198_00094 [Bacillus cereus]